MAQVFISHSSLDQALVDKFVDLLETGLGLHGDDAIFASSIPGKDINMGNVNEYVKNELIDAELAIFMLSPNFLDSRYCWAEVGATWTSDKKTFLFIAPGTDRDDIKAIFDGHQVEKLQTKGSLAKLASVIAKSAIDRKDPGPARWEAKRDDFLEWIKSDYEAVGAPNQKRIEELPGWRDRGHWSESIVDGTLYIGSGYVTMDAKKEIMRTIDRGEVLPTIYSYLTNAGYHNWLRLTEDQTYGYYKDSLGLFDKFGDDLVAKIKTAIGSDEIDLISLGPGDGRKDVVMLNALAKVFDPSDLYYYPFDVNSSMISHAMTATGKVRRLQKIQVKAILADFASLPEFSRIYQYRDAPNVLSLVGNTLGNLPEDRTFLERVYSRAMSDGDLLLLEVRKSQATDPALLRTEANKEFDFGPLEILGVPLDLDKIHYESIDGYSFVPKTKTIISTYETMTYAGKEYEDVGLGLIREYDHGALKDTCNEIGFEVLSEPDHRSAAALLLRK